MQLAITLRLFDRVEVGALDVLDDRDFQHLGIVEVPHDDGDLVNLGPLRGPPAPFAGNDLIAVARRAGPDDQRLDDTLFADRGGQLLQRVFGKGAARLIGIGVKLFDRKPLFGRP
jgi:hypothetical protein